MLGIDESAAGCLDAQGAISMARSNCTASWPSPAISTRPCSPLPNRLEADEQERQDVHDRIDAELHTVGLQHFGEAIAQRMALIEVLAARFNNDSRMIRRLCLEVLNRIAASSNPSFNPAGCGQQA
jgi:hypothetical protein